MGLSILGFRLLFEFVTWSGLLVPVGVLFTLLFVCLVGYVSILVWIWFYCVITLAFLMVVGLRLYGVELLLLFASFD